MRVLFVMLLAVLAQSPAQAQPLDVGQSYKIAFAPSATPLEPGVVIDYRIYVDGALQALALPPLVNGEYVLLMPAFSTPGPHTVRVSAAWRVTDATKWTCDLASVTLPRKDCTEAWATPDPLTLQVATPVGPPPLPPANFRIVLPIRIGDNGGVRLDWADLQIVPVTPATPRDVPVFRFR